MKRLLALLIGTALTFSAAVAQQQPRVRYKKIGFVSGAYDDKALGENHWYVMSYLGAASPYWLTEKVVLYRSSEIVKQGGYRYVKVLSRKGERRFTEGAYNGPSGAKLEVEIAGSNEADASNHCEKDITVACATFDPNQAMAQAAPFLIFKGSK